LLELVAAGQLDVSKICTQHFALAELEPALEAAAAMRGLEMTLLTMNDG
jgi:hypothetical protein